MSLVGLLDDIEVVKNVVLSGGKFSGQMRSLRSVTLLRMRHFCIAATAILILVVAVSRCSHLRLLPLYHGRRSSTQAAQNDVPSRSRAASATDSHGSTAPIELFSTGGGCDGSTSGCFQLPRLVEPLPGNPLWAIVHAQRKGPAVRKWAQYMDVYHRYFQRFRGQQLNMLEIGVQSGGSISLWQSYFGRGLMYYGLDINPYCKELFHSPPDVNIVLGDQGSRNFWQSFRQQMAIASVTFDIILDDGGHEVQQQIVTYEEAWPLLANGGVCICEDTSTSMDTVEAWDYEGHPARAVTQSGPRYGGGYRRLGTWIENAKQFADTVNGHYVNQTAHPDFDPLKWRDSPLSAAFYDQMVVLEKGPQPLAHEVHAGSFLMPIGAQLHDGKIVSEVLAEYRNTADSVL